MAAVLPSPALIPALKPAGCAPPRPTPAQPLEPRRRLPKLTRPRACPIPNLRSARRVRGAPAALPRGFTVRAAAAAGGGGASDDDTVEIALKVDGMMCEGCVESVTEALRKASPDVAAVDVNLESKMVRVGVKAESAVAGLTLMPALVDAVKGAGFDAEPEF